MPSNLNVQRLCKPPVVGSIPTAGSTLKIKDGGWQNEAALVRATWSLATGFSSGAGFRGADDWKRPGLAPARPRSQ